MPLLSLFKANREKASSDKEHIIIIIDMLPLKLILTHTCGMCSAANVCILGWKYKCNLIRNQMERSSDGHSEHSHNFYRRKFH